MEENKDINYVPLLEGVLTVSDRDVFLGQLGELEEEMFKQPVGLNTDSGPSDAEALAGKQARMTDESARMTEESVGIESVLKLVFPYARKAAFVNLLHQEKIESTDLVKIQDAIKAIRDYLSSVPVLSLTLAESPREALLKKIALAVSDQTQQPLFLDISIDSSILGGSKLTWGGKVEDYSLEKRLEEYFSNSKVKGQNSKV